MKLGAGRALIAAAACAAAAAGFSIQNARAADTRTAVFAGGCFWCVEADFDSVEGVVGTTSGYAVALPESGQQAGSRHSRRYEAVTIEFDPDVVSFRELADLFWRSVDPTDEGGQFCDRGSVYRTAVFATAPDDRAVAEASRDAAEAALGMLIVTQVLELEDFSRAAEKHQDYYLGGNRVLTRFGIKRQSEAYKLYRKACGRDARVRELWRDQAAFAR